MMWYILAVAIVLVNGLLCLGLLKAEMLTTIEEVYMPWNGPRREESDDYFERFAARGDSFQMVLLDKKPADDEYQAKWWQFAQDVAEGLPKAYGFKKDGVPQDYTNWFSQSQGQPLRYTKLDCFQEGSVDYHTTLDQLKTAAAGLQVLLDPLDNGQLDGSLQLTITPYDFCLYAEVFQIVDSETFNPKMFGKCRGFLNPKGHEQYAFLQAAYDWAKFFVYDQALLAGGAVPKLCASHSNVIVNNGSYPLIPLYDDCAQNVQLYQANALALPLTGNANTPLEVVVNAILGAQNLTPPQKWNLADYVLDDAGVKAALEETCYMWDGGDDGLALLIPVPDSITSRKDGWLNIWLTPHQDDYCEGKDGDDWDDCVQKIYDFGDKWGDEMTFADNDMYAFAGYQTESDSIESYSANIPLVAIGVGVIVFYVLVVGFYMGTPLLMVIGVFMQILAIVATIGVGSLLGIGIVPVMFTVYPLLLLGIGVDDMFILTCDLENATRALPSIATTSIVNSLVGFLGFTNPVPYVANFSLYFGVASIMLFLANSLGTYSLCRIWHNSRQKSKEMGIELATSTGGSPKGEQNSSAEEPETPCVLHIGVRTLFLLAAIGVTTFMGVVPFGDIEQDFELKTLYKKKSTKWDFWEHFRTAGEYFSVTLVTKDDMDFATMQADWQHFIAAIGDTDTAEDITITWLEMFYQWCIPSVDPAVNPRCADNDPFTFGQCGPKMVAQRAFKAEDLVGGELSPYFGASACMLLPAGAAFLCDGEPCSFGTVAENDPAAMRVHPNHFDACVELWLNNDDKWAFITPAFQCDLDGKHKDCGSVQRGSRKLKGGRVRASKTNIDLSQVTVVIEDWLSFIEDMDEVRGKYPFTTYLYGSYHNVFSSFKDLWKNVFTSFGLTIAAAFVVITLSIVVQTGLSSFVIALPTAFWTVMFMSMAWFCTVCMMSILKIPVMPATTVVILMTLGISVEVMGHIGLEYVKSGGNRESRAMKAVSALWFPLMNGILTTVVATTVFYFSQWYLMSDMIGSIVLVSLAFTLVYGFVCFPSALSILGAPYCSAGASSTDQADQV